MTLHRRGPASAVVGLVLVLTAGGCGDDANPPGPMVTQHVTREFGNAPVSSTQVGLDGHATVLELLRETHDPQLDPHFGSVTSIDGFRAQEGLLDENSWVLSVNGIQTALAPADYKLFPNDVVHWDLRDWHTALPVKATVGAFPQTFSRGVFGKRFPTTVRCAQSVPAACARVRGALRRAGVATDGSSPPSRRPPRGQPQHAEVLVGKWSDWRSAKWPLKIARGPQYSGVFAKFTPRGDRLRLLDWNEQLVRTSGAGTGLVAAMRPTEGRLVWLITGVDDKGVARAARALTSRELAGAFAVAVTDDGIEKLPLRPTSAERAKPPSAAEAERLNVDIAPHEKGPRQEPHVTIPAGPPPRRLLVRDIRRGTGAPVEKGDVVIVNYVGYIHSTRRKYDTSYDRYNPAPLIVNPGRSNYIEGFEKGILGMRLGGRRLVIIPSDMAYGKKGYSNDVKPHQALAFLIDVEEAHHY